VYFAEDANERKPLCGSPDRIKPSPRYEQPVALRARTASTHAGTARNRRSVMRPITC
jgi:hypothetical protein